MANVASVLSILVNADTGAATAKLAKFDRTVQSSQRTARKGIEARLGGNFNQKAFKDYEKVLSRTQRRVRDKNAFKAELGGSFSATGFKAYERAIDKAQKDQAALSHSTGQLHNSFKGLAIGIASVVSAYIGFSVMKDAVKSTLDLAGATAQLTAITGMDAKTASEWIEVFKVRGVQTKMVSMGFITLAKNMKAAQDGSKKAVDAFKELGVTQDMLARGDMNAVLLQTADAFQKMKNPAERAALAQQLFGRNAKSLIPILAQGRKGVEDALGAAERYGAYLPKNIKQLKAARQAQFEMNFALDGLKIAFATAVLPYLMKGVRALLDFISQIRSGTGVGGVFRDVMVALGNALGTIFGVIGDVVGWIKEMVNQFERGNPLAVTFAGALAGIGAALVVIGGASAAKNAIGGLVGMLGSVAASLGPWGLVAVAIAAVAGALVALYLKVPAVRDALNSVWTSMQSAAQTILPILIGAWNALGTAVTSAKNAIVTAVNWITTAWTNMTNWISTAWNNVVKTLGPTITNLFTIIKTVGAPVIAALTIAFRVLSGVVGPVANLFGTVLAGAFRIAWSALSAVANVLGAVLVPAFRAAWGIIKGIVGAFVSVVKGAFDMIRGVIAVFAGLFTLDFRKMWNGIKQIFSGAVNALVGIVKSVFGAMFAVGKGLVTAIGNGLKAAWGGLKALMGTIINSVVSVVKSAFNAFYSAGKYLLGAVISAFKALWGTIKSVAGKIIDSVVNVIEGFFNAAYNAGKFIMNAVKKGFEAAFKAVINTIIDFLNLIIGVIDKIPGVHVGKIGHMAQGGSIDRTGVQALANGGKVTKPMAIVGEEAPRHPEYVIPTNPAYRSRAMGLWQETGSKLGVPGFAKGGYLVKASAEDDVGKTGYRGNIIQSRGYSELSIPPSSLNFSALGNLPYGYPLTVATQAGRAVRVAKQDVGAGSSFNPVMGLYPQTVADLGLSGGEFTVAITDDSRLRPMSTVGAASLAAGGSFLSAMGSAFAAAFGAITDAAGAVASVIAKLPKAPDLPDWIKGLPPYVLEKVGGWIKDKVTSIFPSFLAPVTNVSGAGAPGAGSGGPPPPLGSTHPTWAALDALASRYGLHVSSSRPGGGGWQHDYADGTSRPVGGVPFARAAAANYGTWFDEMIHTPLGWAIDKGRVVDQNVYFGSVLAGHYDHVHIAGGFRKGGIIPALATGGTMAATGLALVGEKGPELVTLPAGATVTPTNAVAGWGGAPYTHWNLPGPNVTDYAPWIQVLRSMIRLPADPTAANNAYRSQRMGFIGNQMSRVRWIGTGSSGGEVNRLTELMRVTQDMWDFTDYPPHSNIADYLSFKTDAKGETMVDAKGDPIIDIDQAGLATRRSHLKQTYDWYVRIRDYLQESWNRLKVGMPPPGVISRIQTVIRERQEEIQQIQQRIKDNIKIIDRANDLVKKIRAHIAQNQQLIGQNQAQWHQLGARLDHPPRDWMPRERDQRKRKASWNSLITQNMIRLQRTIGMLQGPIPGWKANVSALQNLVKPVQNANVMLGGAPHAVGTGGRLKGFNDQVTSLQGMLDEANQTATTVGGQWGWSGELSTAKLDVLKAARTMGEWDDTALQKAMGEFKKGYVAPVGEGAGAGGEGAGVSGADQEALNAAQKLADLYKQQLIDSRQAFAVSQAQYAVLQRWPFAGAYAMGGTVSKRGWSLLGERGPELAQLPVGTRVLNANQTANMTEQSAGPVQVQVVILDGAVDPSKIKIIAEGAAVNVIRGETRRGRRGLAGGGGG